MKRAPELQDFIDGIAKSALGKTHTECQEQAICVIYHRAITDFKDQLSWKEYQISGMLPGVPG